MHEKVVFQKIVINKNWIMCPLQKRQEKEEIAEIQSKQKTQQKLYETFQ